MTPIADFKKSINGLSVNFTDSSFNLPTTWFWNFGDGVNSSNVQNPSITYADYGVYNVVLTATNADGSSTKVITLVLTESPSIGLSLAEMVSCEIPGVIEIDKPCFEASTKKWQLYLQPLVDPEITDADVFNESKWPQLVNVLIAKLIVYDCIIAASKNYLLNITKAESPNTLVPTTTQVSNYYAELPDVLTENTNITSGALTINGVDWPFGGPLTSTIELVNKLNTLGFGYFVLEGKNLKSLGNINLLTTLKYALDGGSLEDLVFNIESTQVVVLNTTAITSEAQEAIQGAVKYIETGPSKVEFFDMANFYKNIFIKGGLMESLTSELCLYASRLSIKLPQCKLVTDTPLFSYVKLCK